MKVWIIVQEISDYDYDEYQIEKVFSTDVAAEHYMKMREAEETALKKKDCDRIKPWFNLIEKEIED
jgi:hypothetical protein